MNGCTPSSLAAILAAVALRPVHGSKRSREVSTPASLGSEMRLPAIRAQIARAAFGEEEPLVAGGCGGVGEHDGAVARGQHCSAVGTGADQIAGAQRIVALPGSREVVVRM